MVTYTWPSISGIGTTYLYYIRLLFMIEGELEVSISVDEVVEIYNMYVAYLIGVISIEVDSEVVTSSVLIHP